jgi:hypothetical protein
MPGDAAAALTGQLICYGRTVVATEWPAMEDGTLGNSVNPWGVEMFRSISAVVPRTAPQQSAYDRWMDQTATREQARQDRVHGAEGVLPWPLWVVLILLSCVVFTFMLFFADPAEAAVTQVLLMGSVTVVVTLLLFLLVFFNKPHGEGFGKLGPTAMTRSLALIDTELTLVGADVTPPCDSRGDAS